MKVTVIGAGPRGLGMCLAAGRARRGGDTARDEAGEEDPRARDGVLRRALLLELAARGGAGERGGSAEGGAAQAREPDYPLRGRNRRPGGRRAGRRPARLRADGDRVSAKPPEHHRRPRRGDGDPSRGGRHRLRPADVRRPRGEAAAALGRKGRDAAFLRRRRPSCEL